MRNRGYFSVDAGESKKRQRTVNGREMKGP